MDLEDGSRSSRHSDSKPEIIDGRDNYEPYPKLRVRIASSDHFEVRLRPEVIDESGSSKHSDSSPKVVDGSDSSKHAKSRQSTHINEVSLLFPAVSLGSSLSSRSSSSLDDLIQVKTKEVLDPNMHSTCSDGADKDTQRKLKGHDNDMYSNSSSKSEESENVLPGPTGISPVSGITHESLTHIMSPMQSPVVQVMDRTSGYDPHRIPSIIFDRPTTPMDWSTTSNDSLFSIHVGNNSFSNDNLFMPADVVKSEELTKSGELMFSQPPPFAAIHRDTKSSIPALGTGQQTVKYEKIEATGVAQVNTKDAKTGAAENPTEDKNPAPSVSWKSSATASLSDESRDSTTSFAFPIRKKKCEWPSCYCSDCSCAFCYCTGLNHFFKWPSHCIRCPNCSFKWPGCSCRWPSCCSIWPRRHCRWPSSCFSNCSWTFCRCPNYSHNWAFCYCRNCSQIKCCHSSPNLADGIRSSFAKTSDEEQQLQPSAPSVNKKSASCCCIHQCGCISCWPWGCTNHCHFC